MEVPLRRARLPSTCALWVTYEAATLVAQSPSILHFLPHLVTLVLVLDICGGEDESERGTLFSALPMLPEADVLSRLQLLLDARPCPELRTLAVYMRTLAQANALVYVLTARAEATMVLLKRLVVGLLDEPGVGVREHLAEAAAPYVQHLTIVEQGDHRGHPEDVLWERKVPRECYEYSKLHKHWPAWM